MATAYHLEALRRQRIIDRAAEARRKKEQEKEHAARKAEASASGQEIDGGGSRPPTASGNRDVGTQTSEHGSRASTGKSNGTRSRANGESTTSSRQTTPNQAQVSSEFQDEAKSRSSRHTTPNQSRTSSATRLKRDEATQLNGQSLQQTPTQSQGSAEGSRSSRRSRPSTAGTRSKHSDEASHNHSRPRSAPHSQTSSASGPKTASHMHGQSRVSTATTSRQQVVESPISMETRRQTPPTTAELKVEAVRKDLQIQEKALHDSNLVMGDVSAEQEIELREMEGDTIPVKR